MECIDWGVGCPECKLVLGGELFRSLITPLMRTPSRAECFHAGQRSTEDHLIHHLSVGKYQDNGATDLGPRFLNLGSVGNVTLSTRLTVVLNTLQMFSREARVSDHCEHVNS
jgi:hypothetical protein